MKHPNGAQRFAQWNLKYNPTHIKETTEAGKPTYGEHALGQFNSIYDMEQAVKQVLNMAGVSVYDVAPYLTFGRQMYAASSTHRGDTLAVEAENLIVKNVARGLTRSVLETIRTQVFNVGPVPSP